MAYNTSFFGGGGSGGGSSTTFTGLTDTPSSYSGQGGKVVKVNGGENALVFEDGGGTTPIDAAYETVALMAAATDISTGDTIATYGYYALNDGGQMVYTVTDTDLSADVDGGSVIDLGDGLYGEAQFPPYYRPEMWGAKGDNSTASATTNATALAAMFNYSRDVKTSPVYFSGGDYYINDAVPFYKPVTGVTYATDYYVVHGNGSTIKSTGRATTSTDTLTIETGSVTLTVASSSEKFVAGDRIRVYANNHAYNFMEGTITDYTGTSLTVDVDTTEYFMRRAWNTNIDLALGSQRINFTAASNQFKSGEAISISSGSWLECSHDYLITGTITATKDSYIDVNITDLGTSVISEVCNTNQTIGTGSKRITGFAEPGRITGGVKVRIEYDASNYMEGTITYRDSGSSFYVDVTTIVGSGTYATWTVTTSGLRNAELSMTSLTHNSWKVASGINMFDRSIDAEQATSTTSQAISTGSKTFTYTKTSNTFFLNTSRSLRIIYDGSNYMSGRVTAFDTNARTVTVNVTNVVGSGTYADWTLDLNMMWTAERAVSGKFDIYDLAFSGQGLQTLDVGLRLACSYGSTIRGGTFTNCQTGYFGEFNLMATYTDAIIFRNEYGARYDKGNWYGASGSNSQSNVANIINYRQFGGAGSKAGVYIKASNSYWLQNFICEGSPSYAGVLFERFGSPNVTVATFDDVHLEVTCYHAFYESIDDEAMNIEMNRVYPQYGNIVANTASDFSYNAVYWVGGSAFIARSNNFNFRPPYNAVSQDAINIYTGYQYFINGEVPFYAYGEFGIGGTRLGRQGMTIGSGETTLTVGQTTTLRRGSTTLLSASTNSVKIGRLDLGYFEYNGNIGVALQQLAGGRAVQITQNPGSNAGGIALKLTLGTSRYSRVQVQLQSTYGAGFVYQYSLPAQAGSDKQIMKLSSGSGSTENLVDFDFVNFLELGDVTDSSYSNLAGAIATVNSDETGIELVPPSETVGEVLKSTGATSTYGYIFGQIVSLLYNTTTLTLSIATGGLRPVSILALNFKATATTMLIEMHCYIIVASQETVTSGLSDDSGTFNDVGSTAVELAENGAGGSHDISMSITKTWFVSGLTIGTAYTWYPSFESTGGSSKLLVDVGVSPFVMKAINGAA